MAISIGNFLAFVPAVGALSTAAMGLVDAAKAFDGGPSNFGFRHITVGLTPFLPTAATGPMFGQIQVLGTLKANYLNGVDAATQKAAAKALIHLGLTPANAPALAAAAGVDVVILTSLTTKVATGQPPLQSEISVLGQFDVILSAVLDEAYERADQKYRNACKLLACAISVVLAVAGTYVYDASWRHFWLACLLGLVAVPFAPVAKDAASALQAVASAWGTARPRV